MKINVRSSFIASSLGLLLTVAPFAAKADTLGVSVWANGTTTNVPTNNAAGNMGIYGTAPTITGTITNADPTAILNFYSSDDSNLFGFLTTSELGAHGANGDTVSLSANQVGLNAINNDLFQFTGNVTLTAGTYTYEHDDGMILYLNGVAVISAPGPTVATPTSFTVCAAGPPTCNAAPGAYSFILDYAEVDGAPAALQGNLPFVPSAVPEPSSFALLGSSLLGAAGMLRRRMKKA